MLLPIMLTFLLLATASALPCHVQGCHPNRQYLIDLSHSSSGVSIAWKTEFARYQPQGDGCTSVCDKVACPVIGSPGLVVFSTNGKILWTSNELTSPPLPLFYVSEGVMDCDGKKLVGYFYNGTTRGRPIDILYPSRAFGVTKTESDIFTLAFSHGMLYTFDILAIPIASIYLKDTVKGMNGTFLPYLTPAVGGEMIYLLAYFMPDGCSSSDDASSVCLEMSAVHRLYAVNNTHLMAPRMNVTWHFEFEVNIEKGEKIERPNLLYFDEIVYFSAVVKDKDSNGRSTVFAVSDQGYKYRQLWMQTFNDTVHAISYYTNTNTDSSADDRVHQIIVTTVSNEDTIFTILDPYTGDKRSVTSLRDVISDDVTVTVTSDVMVALPNSNMSSPAILISRASS